MQACRYKRSRGPLWQSSLHNAVDIVSGYGLDDRGAGVLAPVWWRISSSPCRPDQLWGPHSLLSNGYRETIYSMGEATRLWSWPSHTPVPRSRMVELYLHSPFHFHGMTLNSLGNGVTSTF
jgi:hypothetical protein